ncbi:MAG: type II toxin-antitoxin system YafQ family toxin [Treponema sp.]|nr:type II toxin-antitoxin system YafQ family toxin [Treponema sp.]
MLDFAFTNQFKKDLKLMEKRRKDLGKIYEIMALLIWEEPLPEQCREHKLHGNLEGFTECHIEGDWIMAYILEEDEKITFAFTGTHSDYL